MKLHKIVEYTPTFGKNEGKKRIMVIFTETTNAYEGLIDVDKYGKLLLVLGTTKAQAAKVFTSAKKYTDLKMVEDVDNELYKVVPR